MRSVTQRRISAGGETSFGAVKALNSLTFWGPHLHMGHPGSLVTLLFGSKKPSLPLRCSYACTISGFLIQTMKLQLLLRQVLSGSTLGRSEHDAAHARMQRGEERRCC